MDLLPLREKGYWRQELIDGADRQMLLQQKAKHLAILFRSYGGAGLQSTVCIKLERPKVFGQQYLSVLPVDPYIAGTIAGKNIYA